MTHRYWPLFDMRLASPDLTLRPMAEADLTAIAGLLPDDVEQDPAATTYPIGDDRISRGIVSCQHYWKACGTWHPRGLAAQLRRVRCRAHHRRPGTGGQRLSRPAHGRHLLLPAPPSARGRGYGKQMRDR